MDCGMHHSFVGSNRGELIVQLGSSILPSSHSLPIYKQMKHNGEVLCETESSRSGLVLLSLVFVYNGLRLKGLSRTCYRLVHPAQV